MTEILEVVANGQTIIPGTELSFTETRGRFVFKYATRASTGQLSLTCVGVKGNYRSFRLEQVSTVHRKKKTR